MLDTINPEKILFLDIETVPAMPNYREMPEKWQKLWDNKAKYISKEEQTSEEVYERAGIYAEFGKIICICAGIISPSKEFRIVSFYGEDEYQLLSEFCDLLNNKFNSMEYLLCAHNGKEFDFPYLGRRILINNLKLPYLLDTAGRKPWEVQHLDTLQLWKFGDYKNYTSLELLTELFDIPSPKNDIDGSQVGKVYWEDKDLLRIVKYCQNDTLAVAQLLLKFQNKEIIHPESVIFVN